jgi:hypothetical protein
VLCSCWCCKTDGLFFVAKLKQLVVAIWFLTAYGGYKEKTMNIKYTSVLFCMLLFVFGFSACEKNKTAKLTEIGYGTSFGMCAGYCVNTILIHYSEVVFTKSKNGNSPDTKTCEHEFSAAELDTLKALVKISDFEKLPEVIGCPDCADGGAEWVSLKVEGKVKKVTFEYNNAPEELKDLVTKLRTIKESFKDCN